MAKLLLCCDEYIYRFNDKFYFKNQEWNDFFYRYLRVFEEMRLITRCKDEKYLDINWVELDTNKIDYVPLPFFQGPWEYATKYFTIGEIIKLSIYDCDCALLRIPFAVSERLGKILIKKKIPYALEILSDAEDTWKNTTSFFAKMLWHQIDKNMKKISIHADGISCVTENYLQKHYYSKKQLSFQSHYSTLSLENSFFTSARMHPKNKTFIIANISNQISFDGRKGQIEIIKAISLLKKQQLKVKVRFAGSDYKDGVRKLSMLAKELSVLTQIEFVGYLQRREISDFLDKSDIYVMPTRAEGLSRVIIESMAKGLPCITTNVSGNSELIDGQYLIDYYDINSLAELIKKLVTDKREYEQASLNNYKLSLNYNAEKLQARRDSFYADLKAISLNK